MSPVSLTWATAGQAISTLSGGQFQRLLLAFALKDAEYSFTAQVERLAALACDQL